VRNPSAAAAPPSTFLLGALTALTALSIDMSLPALPALSRAFHAPPAEAQLTLTLFLIGYAVSQIVCGPLSDAFGRRRVLLAGLVVFTVAGFGCFASRTLPMLIAMRVLQGIGASVGPVVARAMVRDTYDRSHAAVVFSHITQVMILAPVLAPALGSYLLAVASWHAIFGILTAAGLLLTVVCILILRETNPHADPRAVHPAVLAGSYREFGANRASVMHMLTVCFAYCGLFAYVSGSPFVLMEVYGVPRSQFGLYFGGTALSLLLGATANKALIRRGVAAERILGYGIVLLAAAGLLTAVGVEIRPLGVFAMLAPIGLYLFAMGIVAPHATASAMHPFPRIAGVISSLVGGLQTFGGGVSGACVGALYDRTGTSLGVTMGLMGIVALLCHAAAHRADGSAEDEEDITVEGGANETA
jgi:DHA1 family bicyclomycin/chloramphenicol resistance-like MFS transporter